MLYEVITQGRYRDMPFEGNNLSHSRIRYAEFRRIYRTVPRVQLGGPTAEWVYEGSYNFV